MLLLTLTLILTLTLTFTLTLTLSVNPNTNANPFSQSAGQVLTLHFTIGPVTFYIEIYSGGNLHDIC